MSKLNDATFAIAPACGKCGLAMTPENARLRPELFLHDACLPDELKPVTPTQSSQEWEGPQTLEEARCYHQGYLSGITVYAREKGDSTLKSRNELLRRLMDEQGWKTVENFERLQNALNLAAADPMKDLRHGCLAALGFLGGVSILTKEQLQKVLVDAVKLSGVNAGCEPE